MSGGHFQYKQHRIEDIAVEIDEMVRENNYPPEIIEKFREASHTLRQSAEMAQRVDWLVSGDDGEESFMRRWQKEVRPYWCNTQPAKGATEGCCPPPPCSAFVGKTVEDEEHGRGTIVGHENGMVFVQLDPHGCRMLTIPETALVPNAELTHPDPKP